MKKGFLSGYKTHVLALVAIVGAIGGYLTGDLSLNEALMAAWAGGVAASMRLGIAKVEKAV